MITIPQITIRLLLFVALPVCAMRAQTPEFTLSAGDVSLAQDMIRQVFLNKNLGERLGVALFKTTDDIIELPQNDPVRREFFLWQVKSIPEFDGNKCFILQRSKDLYGKAPKYVVANKIKRLNIMEGINATRYSFSSGPGRTFLVAYFTDEEKSIPMITPLAGFESVVEIINKDSSKNWISMKTLSEKSLPQFIEMIKLGLEKINAHTGSSH